MTAFQSVPASSSRPAASVGDDYDSQVAAALAASQNEANTGSSGGWVRKEVPLDVVQSEQVCLRLYTCSRCCVRQPLVSVEDHVRSVAPPMCISRCLSAVTTCLG